MAIVQFLRKIWSLWLPEGTPRPLLIACRALVTGTIILWSMTAPDIWTLWAPRAGAAVIAVVAFMCWLGAFMWHRLGDLVELIRLSADLYRRIPEDRRPPLVRSAR